MSINIRDITKIYNIDNQPSYLITTSFDNSDIKTFLVTCYSDLHIEIKRITNLIAFVEKKNINLEQNIDQKDMHQIYYLLSIIKDLNIKDGDKLTINNINNRFEVDNNGCMPPNSIGIDKQYYDEKIKIYENK